MLIFWLVHGFLNTGLQCGLLPESDSLRNPSPLPFHQPRSSRIRSIVKVATSALSLDTRRPADNCRAALRKPRHCDPVCLHAATIRAGRGVGNAIRPKTAIGRLPHAARAERMRGGRQAAFGDPGPADFGPDQ